MHLSRSFPPSETKAEILCIPKNVLQRKFSTLSIFTSYLFHGKLGRKISFRELMENGSRKILKTFPFFASVSLRFLRRTQVEIDQKNIKKSYGALRGKQRASSPFLIIIVPLCYKNIRSQSLIFKEIENIVFYRRIAKHVFRAKSISLHAREKRAPFYLKSMSEKAPK